MNLRPPRPERGSGPAEFATILLPNSSARDGTRKHQGNSQDSIMVDFSDLSERSSTRCHHRCRTPKPGALWRRQHGPGKQQPSRERGFRGGSLAWTSQATIRRAHSTGIHSDRNVRIPALRAATHLINRYFVHQRATVPYFAAPRTPRLCNHHKAKPLAGNPAEGLLLCVPRISSPRRPRRICREDYLPQLVDSTRIPVHLIAVFRTDGQAGTQDRA